MKQLRQSLGSFLDLLPRNLLPFGSWRSRTRKELIHKKRLELVLVAQGHRFVKVALRFGGEAGDDVGGDVDVWHGKAQLVNNATEIGIAVLAFHCSKHFIGTSLGKTGRYFIEFISMCRTKVSQKETSIRKNTVYIKIIQNFI